VSKPLFIFHPLSSNLCLEPEQAPLSNYLLTIPNLPSTFLTPYNLHLTWVSAALGRKATTLLLHRGTAVSIVFKRVAITTSPYDDERLFKLLQTPVMNPDLIYRNHENELAYQASSFYHGCNFAASLVAPLHIYNNGPRLASHHPTHLPPASPERSRNSRQRLV
jgi:hypothetical protein